MGSEQIEVGNRVSFRLSDSVYRTFAKVEAIEVDDFEGMREPLSIYTVRDERHGWVHRVTAEQRGGGVRLESDGSRGPVVIDDDSVPF